MSKVVKKVGRIAAPIVGGALGSIIPGVGTAIGAGLGGALGGASGGGGLKGALLGGATGYLGGGGLGSAALGPTSALTPAVSGSMGSTLGSSFGNIVNQTGAGGSGILGALTRGAGPLSSAARTVAGSLGSSSGGGGLKSALGIGDDAGANLGNIASNVFSGVQGTGAYKDMERAQMGANNRALEAVSPFMQSGQAANSRLSALLGLGGEDQDEVLGTLRSSPGYQFRLDQGQQALDRSLGARGQLFSGRALQETQNLGQGLADQTYNDYVRNLMQQSGQGMQAAGGAADLYGQQGDIQANAILGRSNLMNRSLANVFGQPYEEMQ